MQQVRMEKATVQSDSDGTKTGFPPMYPLAFPAPTPPLHHSVTPSLHTTPPSGQTWSSLVKPFFNLDQGILMFTPPQKWIFVRVFSLVAKNHLKCLAMNHLRSKINLPSPAQSRLIKANQGVFFEPPCPSLHHSVTPSLHSAFIILHFSFPSPASLKNPSAIGR